MTTKPPKTATGQKGQKNTLKKVNQRLQEEVRTLERELEAKTVQLEELNHRIKNHFQTIISMLSMSARSNGDSPSEKQLKKCICRVRSISTVHDLLQGTNQSGEISVKNYVEKLVGKVMEELGSNGSLTLRFDCSDSFNLPPNRLTTMGIILNELVANAVEHAFNGSATGGTLEVEIRKQDSTVELIVQDDGPGVSEDILEQETNTLGLNLVQNMAETQLNGRFEMSNGDGTKFHLRFPET